MPMPTYEYVCTECGAPLEAVQSIHDPALTECPSCHGRLRKVFGNVGVVFQGSGFYRTDSRGKKSAGAPATPKADAASKGSSTGAASSGSGAGSGSSGSPTGSSGSSSAGTSPAPAPQKS
jgi:putative FmdB family regulatory protein